MATHKETAERKARLRRDFIAARGRGQWAAGEAAHSQRALAQQYGLSQFTVGRELKKLADEGLLRTQERVGTFGGAAERAEFYLLVNRDGQSGNPHFQQTQIGFEEAITLRGDAVLTLEKSDVIARAERGALPPIAGIFDLAYWPGEAPLQIAGQTVEARVSAAKRFESRPGYDLASFDDEAGGQMATRHLLRLGHEKIAFLALHSDAQESSIVDWSAQRENGWREALENQGLESEGLAFHPSQDAMGLSTLTDSGVVASSAHRELAMAVQSLIERPDITAVVAANDAAALELLRALRAAHIAPERWPAIVGFDNHPLAQGQLLTSLQLPFDEMGRTAGQLLWERHNGKLDEAPQQRLVAMRLITRLTCQPAWAQHATPMHTSPLAATPTIL